MIAARLARGTAGWGTRRVGVSRKDAVGERNG